MKQSEFIHEIESLSLLIDQTNSGLIAFALVWDKDDRDLAIHSIKNRISLDVYEINLSEGDFDIFKLIKKKVISNNRSAIFFDNIEFALPAMANYLNVQRDSFAKISHAIIFWVGEHAIKQIASNAPDFWAWRSGLFDFRLSLTQFYIPPLAAWKFENSIFNESNDTISSRINNYKNLFNFFSKLENPDNKFLLKCELQIGEDYYYLNDNYQAANFAEAALRRNKIIGDNISEGKALEILAMVDLKQELYSESAMKYHKTLALFNEDGHDIAVIYHQLGVISYIFHDINEAERCFNKARAIFEKYDYIRDAANTYYNLGIIMREKNFLEMAEILNERALVFFKAKNIKLKEAYCNNLKAAIANDKHDFLLAIDLCKNAAEIFNQHGLERETGHIYFLLGSIYFAVQSNYSSLSNYLKAYDIFNKLSLFKEIAITCREIGILYLLIKEINKGKQYLLEGIELEDRMNLQIFPFKSLFKIGDMLLAEGEYIEAIPWLGKALHFANKIKMKEEEEIRDKLIMILNNIGETQFKKHWQEQLSVSAPKF